MKFSPVALAPLVAFTSCTSVKVHHLTEERFPRVPPKQVQFVSSEFAGQRSNVKIATIDMHTRSPFAADLNQLARERTGKLGGDAYVRTGGQSQTVVTGGFGSLFGDSTSSSMSIEALRWSDQPAPEASQNKKKSPAAPAQPGGNTPPTTEPASKPAKTKAWWRPWSWF